MPARSVAGILLVLPALAALVGKAFGMGLGVGVVLMVLVVIVR